MLQSLDRSLSILEYLSKRKSAGVTEIAAAFSLDKGTVSRILKTFEGHGMVAKNTENGKYHIGSGTLQLSHNVLRNNRIAQISRPTLSEIARLTGATARLCMIDGKQIFIIDQIQASSMRVNADADIPGTTKPMYCSAIGKTILAFMPRQQANEWLDRIDIVAYTENTITDREQLLRQLAEIRAQGYALNLAEYSDRAYCVAVPVFCDDDELPRYCLGITGRGDYRADPENFAHIIRCMKEASEKITRDSRVRRWDGES